MWQRVISSDQLKCLLEIVNPRVTGVKLEKLLEFLDFPFDQVKLHQFGLFLHNHIIPVEIRKPIPIRHPNFFNSSAQLFIVQLHHLIIHDFFRHQKLRHILPTHNRYPHLRSIWPNQPIDAMSPQIPKLIKTRIRLSLDPHVKPQKVSYLIRLEPLKIVIVSPFRNIVVIIPDLFFVRVLFD